ncbi:hypothetical protein [Marinomonas sp. 5E14-1]|uniref:hypothetical protein n=1 Tax=Marinomonas sp. 5E14-1 TaxID=3153922 RepID=UPI003264E782
MTVVVAIYCVLSNCVQSKYTLIGGPPAWVMKLVKPLKAHQNFPASAFKGFDFELLFFLGQELIVKSMAMTPTMAVGMHFMSCSVLHFFQNFCTAKMSMTQRIGSIMAAVSVGDVCNYMSGVAITPKALEKLPFDMPVINTANAMSNMNNQFMNNL